MNLLRKSKCALCNAAVVYDTILHTLSCKCGIVQGSIPTPEQLAEMFYLHLDGARAPKGILQPTLRQQKRLGKEWREVVCTAYYEKAEEEDFE